MPSTFTVDGIVSFFAFLSVNFVIVTAGFFFEDKVTFTLIFLDETVRVAPFCAGIAVGVVLFCFESSCFESSCFELSDGVSSFYASFHGFSVSDINLTGILCSMAYLYAAESLLQMIVTLGEF